MPLNIPNALTWARIAMIPVFVGLFYLPESWMPIATQNLVATVIFVAAAVTDWFDGYLARALGQTSAFGAFLDPVADKLMVAAALILLVQLGRLADGGRRQHGVAVADPRGDHLVGPAQPVPVERLGRCRGGDSVHSLFLLAPRLGRPAHSRKHLPAAGGRTVTLASPVTSVFHAAIPATIAPCSPIATPFMPATMPTFSSTSS